MNEPNQLEQKALALFSSLNLDEKITYLSRLRALVDRRSHVTVPLEKATETIS